jgi:CBS domain-containing protein
MRRKRRDTQPGTFEDPLKNYDPLDSTDPLERGLCLDRVDVVQVKPFTTLDADATIQDALALMAKHEIACLLITQHDKLVGIFSERDVLNRVAHRYDEIKFKPVRDYMTDKPAAVYETDSPAKALNLMATGGFRHVPILNVEDKVVGIIGPRRVTAYLQKLLKKST